MKSKLLPSVFLISLFSGAYAQNPPTYYGSGAGTLGLGSSYFGYQAGKSATEDGEGASYNSFFGELCGQATTTGVANTAMGFEALYSTTTQSSNTAIGFRSLYASRGHSNTAVGFHSLHDNTTGASNTAIGQSSMRFNEIGSRNIALGSYALSGNRSGHENIAVGHSALYFNSGSYNVAVGSYANYKNEAGTYNTTAGQKAMYENVSGHFNSAFGVRSLINNETGSFNSAYGAYAGPTVIDLTNTPALGYNAVPTASNQVRIGNTNVTSIGGKVSWSTFSDGRFKKEVKEDVSGLEFINQLRPVSYSLDENAIDKFLRIPDSLQSSNAASRKLAVRQTGFIAQEVEAIVKKTGYVFHGVEAPQNEGDHYAIRYAEFVVPLVKAVQELTKEVEVLKQKLASTGKRAGFENAVEAILFQNHPNPFSTDTEINVSLPETSGQANIIVYTLEGKQLKVIPIRERGNAGVKILANEMSAGMYLYALIVDGKVVDTKRMILTGY
jgi:hypothetical protein